jgi:hypothetical protein
MGISCINTDLVTDPGIWSLDNLGSTLIALIHDSECFEWDGDATNATQQELQLYLVHQQHHVIC